MQSDGQRIGFNDVPFYFAPDLAGQLQPRTQFPLDSCVILQRTMILIKFIYGTPTAGGGIHQPIRTINLDTVDCLTPCPTIFLLFWYCWTVSVFLIAPKKVAPIVCRLPARFPMTPWFVAILNCVLFRPTIQTQTP